MNPRSFSHYIGIDYSGASTPSKRSSSLQVYLAQQGMPPQRIESLGSTPKAKRNWNRLEVYDWLANFLDSHASVIVGIDHGFSFPHSYFKEYGLADWDEFLVDFVSHWPTDLPDATVEKFRSDAKRTGNSKELRLTEKWTSSAKSVFQFDVQGSVAKSTHAGLPFLLKLRKKCPELHCWPFDGFDVPNNRSVIAEIYPSLFRNRYPREDRTVDQQDAYSVCRWLQEIDQGFGLARFLVPPLTTTQKELAQKEGWILGVT